MSLPTGQGTTFVVLVALLFLIPSVGSAGAGVAGPPFGAPAADGIGPARPEPSPLASAGPAPALSFPAGAAWPTYEHDIGRSGNAGNETVLSVGDAPAIQRVWATNASGSLGTVSGSLTVAGGLLYAGSWNGRLYEIDATNGTAVWNLSLANAYHAINFSNPSTYWDEGGISSTPTVTRRIVGGVPYTTVYVTAGAADLVAVNASTDSPGSPPSVLWTENTTAFSTRSGTASTWGDHYLWASPVVYGGYAYIGLSALYDAAPVQGQVLQIPLTGSSHAPVAVFNVTGQSQDPADLAGSIWSTSAVDPATNTLWVSTGNNNYPSETGVQPLTESLLALNASNVSELRGSYRATEPASGPGDFDYGAGPTLFEGSGGAAYVGAINKDGGFYAYNRTNFSRGPCANDSDLTGGHCLVPAWGGSVPALASPAYGSPNSIAPAAVGGGRLYVAAGNRASTYVGGSITALDPSTGTVLWRDLTDGETPLAGLAYANGLLLCAEDNGTGRYASYGPGVLLILDASNGTVLRTLRFNQSIAGGPIVSDGRIFVGTGNFSSMAGANGTGWIDAFGVPLSVEAKVLSASNQTAMATFSATASGGMPEYGYTWNFGDGSRPGSGPDPTHVYNSSGTYAVTVTTTDLTGASVTRNLTIAFALTGTASVSVDPVDVGGTVWLNITPAGAHPLIGVLWTNLPPGCPSRSVPALACTPTAPGPFVAFANWTDTAGGYGTIEFPAVDVVPAPTMRLVLTPGAGPSNLTVQASVAVTGGTPPFEVSYAWGDGNVSAGGTTAHHTYARPGPYEVWANGTDGGGGRASANATIVLVTAFVATISASPPAIDVGQTTVLQVTPSGGTAPYAVAWTGLPSGCAGANASRIPCTPLRAGNFSVGATVVDAGGRSTPVRLFLSVAPRLSARANAQVQPVGGSCSGPWQVELSAAISGGAPPIRIAWLGPGGTPLGTGPNATVPESAPGPFVFELVTNDSRGGWSDAGVNVTVTPIGCSGASFFQGPWPWVALTGFVLALGTTILLSNRRRSRRRNTAPTPSRDPPSGPASPPSA